MSIRIGIVGLGKIARDQHIPALENSGDFEIAAVASRNSALPGVRAYKTIEDMLAGATDLNAVSLCQPPQVRFDAARAAIAAGLHVFLEKPPGATLSEVDALAASANRAGVTLFASWHSRYAPGVEPARAWLANKKIRSASIIWKEDVRRWHPGQTWIWAPGGFGVFDPGINALSIATRILPGAFFLTGGDMYFPANCGAPIAADLAFRDLNGAPITAAFDFRQTGPQTWDIRVETDAGELLVSSGGAALKIAGEAEELPPEEEYRGLYRRFASLISEKASDVDTAPLRHVADAFMRCARNIVEPFYE